MGTVAASPSSLHTTIRGYYAAYAEDGKGEADWERNLQELGYGQEEKALVDSEQILKVQCGAGNPFIAGKPHVGGLVIDLGSGAGNDALIAGRCVGPSGRVVGLDMTEEMVKLARENAKKVGLARTVEFHVARFDDDTMDPRIPGDIRGRADLVISNGALNLSPQKPNAIALAYDLLKHGGRLQLADVVRVGDKDRKTSKCKLGRDAGVRTVPCDATRDKNNPETGCLLNPSFNFCKIPPLY
mmetsp:Transcript_31576/g.77065  ORF Transcript_31576/g.77065 Transcript_31576/m.77065 type:complete len:242 (+) Transcript_31576:67-792(+)